MPSKSRTFLYTLFTVMALTCVLSAFAQDPESCFTLASLKGSYTVIGVYGANEAIALAKRELDGAGNLIGTFLVNEPVAGSTTGARSIVTGTQAGTVTVNCDGTGVISRTLTVSGILTQQYDDFVITRAEVREGHLIATTIVDAQRTPSAIVAGGVFLTRTWTRVPDPIQHEF
jgi:hypothetical protein